MLHRHKHCQTAEALWHDEMTWQVHHSTMTSVSSTLILVNGYTFDMLLHWQQLFVVNSLALLGSISNREARLSQRYDQLKDQPEENWLLEKNEKIFWSKFCLKVATIVIIEVEANLICQNLLSAINFRHRSWIFQHNPLVVNMAP